MTRHGRSHHPLALVARIVLLGPLACGGDPGAGARAGGPPPSSEAPASGARASEAAAPQAPAAEPVAEDEANGGRDAGPPSAPAEPPPAGSGERAAAPCPAEAAWPDGMVCVPGGWYERGATTGEENALPVERVFVSTFFLDRTEVPNEAYDACIEAGVCGTPMRYRGFRGPRQPAIAMDWADAVAFCQRLGRRLPTEAEWERAARGPEGSTYPFGEDTSDICDKAWIRDGRGPGCGTGVTRDVGTLPPGHHGLHDMAGNVDEWVQDWYSSCYRGCARECGDACVGEDPRGPCDGAAECERHRLRVIRGGSWWWEPERTRGFRRRGVPPVNEANHRFGFRCAADLPAPG